MRHPRSLVVTAIAFAALVAPAVASAGEHSTRIVGGTDVPAGRYDAVANVNIANTFGCTGTLVTRDWVLSAGHCGSLTGATGLGTPIGWPSGAITVTLGTRNTNGAGGTTTTVDQVKLPPGYLLSDGYDISLLHLSAPSNLAPVQVAGKGAQPLWAPGVSEIIAGFGVTSSGGPAPRVMQEARVPIVTDAYCASKYSGFEPGTQLCAGLAQGGVDACQGDSGGPMFATDAVGALKIVGTTSYGDGCGEADTPGVYARVADTTLREWIRSVAGAEAVDDNVALAAPTPAGAVQTTTQPPAPTPAPAMTTAQPSNGSVQGPAEKPASGQSPAGADSQTARPPATKTACAPRKVTIRLKARYAKRVRSAVVLLNGRRIGTLRTARSGVPVNLVRAKRGPAVVRVVMMLRGGGKQTDTRRLSFCAKA